MAMTNPWVSRIGPRSHTCRLACAGNWAEHQHSMRVLQSNAPGIGISTTNPGLAEQLPNWTLLDQHGDARSSQISQHLGGPAISDAGTSSGLEGTLPDAIVRLVDTDTLDGTGELTFPALGADLTSLATGWEEGA